MEDLHERWPHRWITSKAKAINSKIHRIGVVADEDIKEEEVIAVLGGIIIPTKEINEYWEKVGHIGIQINEDFFIVPSTRDEAKKKGIFNHSCLPNCGFRDTITLVAIRDIKKGEEILFDYAFCETMNNGFECECGSENCRKVIRGSDWEIKEIQKKFGKYFSPYLKLKFEEDL